MSPRQLSRSGLIGLVTGLLGALSALVLLAWPPQVAEGLVSYPFTNDGFLVAQAWFFVHHLGLLLTVVALAFSGAAGTGLLARGGTWLAVVGLVLLDGAELLAMRYADWDEDVANAGLMGSSYGLAVNAIGIGMIAAGLGVLRSGRWTGWHRWIPLAIGVAVFVVVTPGMFAGFVTARLAIGAWMLLFAALGWSVYAESRSGVPAREAPRTAAAM